MSNVRRTIARRLPREKFAALIAKGLEWQFRPAVQRRLNELVEDEWRENTLLLALKDSRRYDCRSCGIEVEAKVDQHGVHWCPGCRHPLKNIGSQSHIGSYLLLFSDGGKRIEYIQDWHKYDIVPTIIVEMTDDTLFDIVQGRQFPSEFRKVTPYEAFCAGLISIDEGTENWLVHIARLSVILEGIDEFLKKEE